MFNLPIEVHIDNLIEDLRIFSWEAADILLFYSKKLKDKEFKKELIKNKKNNEPVTLADLKVNNLIINRMKEKYSNVNWRLLSEEDGIIQFNNRKIQSDWLWVLDPLDGTKDFIQKTGEYGMHFALNYKNKPLIGVVLIPEKDELWISNSKKVWCESRNGIEKKVNLSKNKELSEMTLVNSKNHNNEILRILIEKIGFKKSLSMGSIGCKIASILRGESDIYMSLSLPGKSSPKDWDFAAPEAILRTAGGAITYLNNKEITYNKLNYKQDGIIIASSDSSIHRAICEKITYIIEANNIFPIIN